MATTDLVTEYHAHIVPFLCHKLFGEFNKGHRDFHGIGGAQVDRLYEHYESKMFKTNVSSVVFQDLKNGMEVKLRTLRSWWDRLGYHYLYVPLFEADIKNKTGDIILGIINIKNKTLDRMLIPYEVHSKQKNLWITLSSKTGKYGKYHKYLISSESFLVEGDDEWEQPQDSAKASSQQNLPVQGELELRV